MSCTYADGLSPYENKGKLGLKEIFDPPEVVKDKVKVLAGWVEEAKHVVIHTGAGISTSAGIPDFRGPKGVWTLEAKGEKPTIDISFDKAVPTKTHMSILKLVQAGLVQYVVSQNIDGLHLKSGLARDSLSELHGNMYIEECNICSRQFVMEKATSSVGQKCLERRCRSKARRPCRGKTFDTILDWEAGLPQLDLDMAYYHSYVADLNICLGTTLQINPSGNLPLNGKKKSSGKLVICNLQPTKHDKKADLIINTYVDDMMDLLLGMLDLKMQEYSPETDPTQSAVDKLCDWTISENHLKHMKSLYQQELKNLKTNSKKRMDRIKRENDSNEFIKKPKVENRSGKKSNFFKVKTEIKSEEIEIKKEVVEETSTFEINDSNLQDFPVDDNRSDLIDRANSLNDNSQHLIPHNNILKENDILDESDDNEKSLASHNRQNVEEINLSNGGGQIESGLTNNPLNINNDIS